MENILQDITIYPIKGLKGISVQEEACMERGLKHDRRYLIVDEAGKFLSQRELTVMALISTTINGNNLTLTYQGDSIDIKLGFHSKEKTHSKIWSHEFDSYLVDPSIDVWLSSVLNKTCRLVYMDKDIVRNKSLIKSPGTTELSYADGYPYLLLGSASVDLINNKVDQEIKPDRFRANLYVTTQEAHVEDEWLDIQIGEAKFRVIKPCARCKVITINQQTAQQGLEPLATLNTYRKFGRKINFGANTICLTPGAVIKKGDKVILCKK